MHCAVSYGINLMRNAEFWTSESTMKSQQLSAAFRVVNTMQWQVQHATTIIIINNKSSPQLSAHNTNGCLKNMY